MAYWWFRLVISGRFIERFLYLQRTDRKQQAKHDGAPPLSHRGFSRG